MTAKERAQEISKSFYRPETGYSDDELYLSAMAMADWMAEKACEWLEDNVNDTYLDWYDWEKCRLNKDELLRDFREAMKEEIGMTKEDKEPRLAKEDKELLFKDICSRLPYAVI